MCSLMCACVCTHLHVCARAHARLCRCRRVCVCFPFCHILKNHSPDPIGSLCSIDRVNVAQMQTVARVNVACQAC